MLIFLLRLIIGSNLYYALTMQNSNKIIEKLDLFIRKYYKSRLIKGVLYTVALLVALFLVIVLLEHFGYFSTGVRMVLFWGYWVVLAAVVGWYVIVPLLKMYRMGKVISYEDAARIIGSHFPEIRDKLLNLLQLSKDAEEMASRPVSDDEQPFDTALIMAAVEQKTAQLSVIPFSNAVDLKVNRKYVKYALIPLLILSVILIIKPKVITEPSKRLVNNTVAYERPAPFSFVVKNDALEVAQQEDFLLQVEVEGDAVPNEAFINVDGRLFKMKQLDKTHYTYLFKTLQRSADFHFEAAGVTSMPYTLKVFPKPSVMGLQAQLTYPAYTGKGSELITNVGDLSVPQGTFIRWQFQTKDVDTLYYYFADGAPLPYCPDKNGRMVIEKRALQSFDYGFFATNHYTHLADTLKYGVSVIADVAPMILAMEMRDSLTPSRIYFKGRIKDDYGFTKLEFKLFKTNQKDTSRNQTVIIPVAISNEVSQEFYYTYNLNELVIGSGDMIRYYFEVWDNDAINGPKSAQSQSFEISIPTQEELTQRLDKNYDQIEEKAEKSISELKKLQKEIDDMLQKLVDKKDLSWQDKKQLEDLLKKESQVKEEMRKMQQQIQENNRLEEQYRDQSEKIMEKQKELDKLIDQVMNDEMKELMKQMEELMHEQDKKRVQQELENLKLKNDDIERQLDQNIELMKRLEMEKKVEETVKRMDDLAQKQRELAEKTEGSKGKDKEDLAKQQEQLQKDFDQLKKDIDKIQNDYKKIDENLDFKVDKELEQKISNEQKDAQDKLQKGKNREASMQQKEAADDMEKMSEQMAQAQMEMEQEELAEDAEQVRQLLKNVVNLSFQQESLISQLNAVYIQDPKYQQIIKQQHIIKEDFRNVRDSLQAMARRQTAIASVVNKEVSAINSNIQKALSSLLQYNQTFYGNMKNTSATKNMQYSMTSLNNLALVMAEALDQMQNQQRQNEQKKKNGSCKNQGMKMKSSSCPNPGKGKPSAKSIKQMQDELNKQINALKKQLDKQGQQKANQRTKAGQQGSMSEEFAKQAAQQEMIRRMMQQLGQEIKNQNAGNSKLAREIDEMIRQMEQTETDLVNKTITQQTIKRQQQIMTRLLEHEKAEMQREKENRRESKEAKEQYQPSPADLERFNKMQQNNLELFRSVPPSMTPFYKNKVNDYFYKF